MFFGGHLLIIFWNQEPVFSISPTNSHNCALLMASATACNNTRTYTAVYSIFSLASLASLASLPICTPVSRSCRAHTPANEILSATRAGTNVLTTAYSSCFV